jgi:hypothetical protein
MSNAGCKATFTPAQAEAGRVAYENSAVNVTLPHCWDETRRKASRRPPVMGAVSIRFSQGRVSGGPALQWPGGSFFSKRKHPSYSASTEVTQTGFSS